MNTRYLATGILTALLAVVWVIGCDDRNDADLPAEIYTLAANYASTGVIHHVDVKGNYIAIAASEAGAQILHVADLDYIEAVHTYAPPVTAGALWVAFDPDLQIFAAVLDGPDPLYGDKPIFHYHLDTPTADFVADVGLSGPFGEFMMEADAVPPEQSMTFWGTNRLGFDGLDATHICRDSVTGLWRGTNCGFLTPTYFPARDEIRGFDKRGDLVAVAIESEGIHIEDVSSNTGVADLFTPGIAWDCAWMGDYIVIADRYFVTVVDASELGSPEVVTPFMIDGADRLSVVAIDGDYACVLDDFDGIYILDMTNPTRPEVVQEISLVEPTWVATGDGRLYVTDEQQGLLIFERN